MEIFIKLFNGNLTKIFDTQNDKKKEIILTTVNDFQNEAEVEFYSENRLLKKILFKDLPPVRARVLDLPVSLELKNGELFLTHKGKNESINKNSIDLGNVNRKLNFIYFIPILLIIIVIFFAALFIIKLSKSPKDSKMKKNIAINKIEKQIKDNKKIIEKKESKYDKKSLKSIVESNTPIYFVKDEAKLRKNEIDKLNRIIKHLKNYKNVNLLMEGHTEDIGKPENERYLSVKRAGYIKKIILEKIGKDKIDIKIKGFGASKIKIQNASDNEKHLNRRVEIIVEDAIGK